MEFNLIPSGWKVGRLCSLALLTLAISGCGAEVEKEVQLVDLRTLEPSEQCEFGGSEVRTGFDTNENTQLDDNEVLSTSYDCNSAGQSEDTQLVDLRTILPSQQCEFGGREVRTGYDNKNNVLDADEVSSSSFDCNLAEPPIEFAHSARFSVTEDGALSDQLTFSGDNSDALFQLSLHPFKGSVELNADGTFIYTANPNVNGEDVFTFNVLVNGVLTNTAVVELNIQAVNDAPRAQTSEFYAYNSSLSQVQLSASDIDSENLIYSLEETSLFGSASISETGLLTYSANEGYLGEDTLLFSVSDGELSSSAQVSISVTSTVLEISAPSYSIEQGVIEQRKATITNSGDNFILIWTVNWPQWYSLVTDVISVPPKSEIEVAFDIDASYLTNGRHQGLVAFSSAEPGMPVLIQTLELIVVDNITPPAAINDFSTNGDIKFDGVQLQWTAVADSGKRGVPVSTYDIRFSNELITSQNWNLATSIDGPNNPAEPEMLDSIEVAGLSADTTYFFAIKSEDRNELASSISNVISFKTALAPVPTVSDDITLTLRESEQTSAFITLSNTGSSILTYDTSVNASTVPSHNSQTAITPFSKQKAFTESSVINSNGNIIIKFNDVPASRTFNELMTQYKLKERESIDALNLKVVSPEQLEPSAILQLINELNALPQVDYAEPDFNVQSFYLPNDALLSQQWALINEGQTGGVYDADIDATDAWDQYRNGSQTLLAVIDTGVKYDHEDLMENAWVNTGEIAGNGIDDDNNGYIDDVYGYDFANSDNDPMDDNDHGSHCSGIIAAKGDNGLGISGAAHSAKIMAVKFLTAGGSGSTSGAINSVIYAVDNGAKILNNSWGGGGYSQALFDAISYANDNDVLFIAAAGNASSNNDDSPSYPASYDLPNVISVASTDDNDQLSYFSNYGLSVDIAAPGSNILSTLSNGSYGTMSGTSMATPYVAGAAVLLRSNFPSLTALETKEILLSSVDVLDHLTGIVATDGRLNINNALMQVSTPNYLAIISGASGELASGESVEIEIAVDVTNKRAGLYENTISILTNAPSYENIAVALDIHVQFDLEAPAVIDDLQVNDVASDTVILQWTNTGDDGLNGQSSEIDLAYSAAPITAENWSDATHVEAIVPLASGIAQQYTLTNLVPQTLYYVAMKVMDNSAQYSEISNVIMATTGVGALLVVNPESIPAVSLNPSETSTVSFEIENSGDEILHYKIKLVEQTPVLESVQFNSQYHEKGEHDLRVGSAVSQSSAGPDAYGYSWSDSDDGLVQYDWTDITAIGTGLSFSDDSVSTAIDLGFTFNFYGVEYSQVYISSNGFLSFENIGSGCCSGQPLPSADNYRNLIAWAWKDLHPKNGSVHYFTDGNDFVVQFTDYGEFSGTGTVTAQVIISSYGGIKLQYNNFSNDFNVSNVSIGIENQDSTIGLQVAFNTGYLKDALAVNISPVVPWLSVSQRLGQIDPEQTQTIDLVFDSTDVAPGDYAGAVIIESNDVTRSEVILPVLFEVVEAL